MAQVANPIALGDVIQTGLDSLVPEQGTLRNNALALLSFESL